MGSESESARGLTLLRKSMDTARWLRGPGDRRPRYRCYKLTYDTLGIVQYFYISRSWWYLGGKKGRGEEIGSVERGFGFGRGNEA